MPKKRDTDDWFEKKQAALFEHAQLYDHEREEKLENSISERA